MKTFLHFALCAGTAGALCTGTAGALLAGGAMTLFGSAACAESNTNQDPPIPADKEVVTLPSGLQYSILEAAPEGAEVPRMGDQVRVHYTGWLTDGKMFDSSRKPRRPGMPVEPFTTALGDVIEGWNEGLQHCPVGGRIKLTIPPDLGYGAKDSGPIPANSTLVFDVQVIEIVERALPAVEWSSDEGKTQRSETGLQWQVLDPGKGEPIGSTRVALAKFSLRNLGGGYIAGSTSTQVGPLTLNAGPARWRFLAEVGPIMALGSRVLFKVPAGLAFGQQELPGLPAGSDSLWQLELSQVAPEFQLPPDDQLTTTPSGLKYQVLRQGTGETPKATSTVKAHYTGWLTSGKKFDSSWDRGQAADFPLQGVVRGWTEGLQLVQEGGSILLVIPPELGYGAQAKATIPANSTLVFVVDLIDSK
jgi:FKBP-type peptidyl-prolyl cis-trans isomerase